MMRAVAFGGATTLTELGLGIAGNATGAIGDVENPGTIKTTTNAGNGTGSVNIVVT